MGILDPCEKEPSDAFSNLTSQQREDITVAAQNILRLIAFRQVTLFQNFGDTACFIHQYFDQNQNNTDNIVLFSDS